MYVSISGEDKILVFAVDRETGELVRQGEVTVSGRPAPLAMDPQRRFLYAGSRTDCGVSSFRIDQSSGDLSLIGRVPLESDPCYLATDRTGRFLFSAYYSAGKIGVHPIGKDGAAHDPPVEWITTARGAHCMQSDPSNKFVFVPHIAGDVGPNHILQYRFDENTGRVTPNSPFELSPEEPVGPRHYCFHPSHDILYFSNEQGCSVTAYNLDTSAGTLTAFQTVPTLPDDYDGDNACAQIQVSPTGRALYAPNRGHNSIACFSIDPSTGGLTSIGQVPTEPIPRVLNLDPDGNFLFVAGLESGRLASYRIDSDTGQLTPLQTYDVGEEPMWILVVPAG
jgi:6-phosphogluconolactonase